MSSVIRSLESHSPKVQNTFTFGLSVEVPYVKFTNSGLSFSLFYFPFSFYFYFIFLFFYFQNLGLGLGHKTQRTKQKDLEQIMSYNMDIICWPYVLYMVVQGRIHSSEHGPWLVVYKVEQFVERSLSSSLMLLNTRVVLLSNSKDLSS